MTYDVTLLALKVMKIKIISIQYNYHENRIEHKSNDNFLTIHAITRHYFYMSYP